MCLPQLTLLSLNLLLLLLVPLYGPLPILIRLLILAFIELHLCHSSSQLILQLLKVLLVLHIDLLYLVLVLTLLLRQLLLVDCPQVIRSGLRGFVDPLGLHEVHRELILQHPYVGVVFTLETLHYSLKAHAFLHEDLL